jgi:hypothetical protein
MQAQHTALTRTFGNKLVPTTTNLKRMVWVREGRPVSRPSVLPSGYGTRKPDINYSDVLKFPFMQFSDAFSDDRAGNANRGSSAQLCSDTTYTEVGMRAVYIPEQ